LSHFNTNDYYNNNPGARRVALIVVCLGSFLNPLILSSVLVAIPSIADDLKADAVLVSWIPTSFLLTSVILMLPFGKLSDMYGRKKIYISGIVTLTIASLLASFSPNIYWLLACRVLQGVGAAQTMGSGMAIITGVFPKESRGAPLGYAATAVYIGLTSGPLLGGFFTDHFGWRSVFLFHLPVAISVAVMTLWKLKGDWKSEIRPKFDIIGALTFAIWAILVLLGLSFMPSWQGVFTLLVSLVFGAFFIYHQSHTEHPLVRVGALRANRVFSFSLISAFLLYSATFPITFLLSLYLQYIKGVSPSLAGQYLIVQALIMALVAPLAGRLSDIYEPRLLTTFGCACVAVGFALLMRIGFDTPIYYVPLSQALFGLGFGFFTTPNNHAALGSLTNAGLGIASAILNLSRTLGNMIGMGVVMMIIAINMGDALIVPENYNQLLAAIKTVIIISFCYSIIAGFYSFYRGRVREKIAD